MVKSIKPKANGYVSPMTHPYIRSRKQFVDYVKGDRSVSKGWTRPGFQAMVVYRFGIWRYSVRNPFIRKPMSGLYKLLHILVRNLYGIEINATAAIGRRLHIAHQHGITIHGNAVVGDDCLIRQGVSLGGNNAAPVLGNRVEIGANSVVIGGVIIGDDVMIGPCVSVMRSISSGSIVVATPPRVMRQPPNTKTAATE